MSAAFPSYRCVLLLAALASGPLAAEVPTGRVLATVACTTDAAQTYALYVPTRFDRSRTWPVLFCFDPGARGLAPVERFRAAAEKFGWIVAGSNNSRNGPWEANAAAIQAMMGDVARHLPVDRQRIYVAGLSGGARVACQLAVSGLARGVIACSAGFMGSETPDRVPFPFFGTAGITDFNYRELRRTERELAERKAAHRVAIFPGGHEWLPESLAHEALAWLDLHAMRTGAVPREPAWIEEQWRTRQAAVPREPVLDRAQALQALAADFKGLADTAAVEREAKALAASRAGRDALRDARRAEQSEQAQHDRLMTAAAEGVAAGERQNIADLQEKARSAPAAGERARAQRILQGVASGCSELARQAMREREHAAAADLLEMAVLIRPERPQAHFELARARGTLGDRKRALAALEAAVAAGFQDAARLRTEPAFAKLRQDTAFLALLAKME